MGDAVPRGKNKRARRRKEIARGEQNLSVWSRRTIDPPTHLEHLLDLDQVVEDLKQPPPQQPLDLDLPGLGQFYCRECNRYFVDQETLDQHKATKRHKRRLRLLQEEPHTQEAAERAAGMGGVDNGPRLRRRVDTVDAAGGRFLR